MWVARSDPASAEGAVFGKQVAGECAAVRFIGGLVQLNDLPADKHVVVVSRNFPAVFLVKNLLFPAEEARRCCHVAPFIHPSQFL